MNNIRFFSAAIILFCLVNENAAASDWKYLISQDDGNGNEIDWFIDVSSITKEGDLRRVKEKATFEPFSRKGFRENSKKWERKYISVRTFDCRQLRVQTEAMTVYYYDGTRSVETIPNEYPGWPLANGDDTTINGRIFKIVCGDK